MQPDFNFLPNNLENAFGWMIIHSIWQATLIAIITGIVLILLQKKSAQMRYIVANAALILVLISAMGTFYFHLETAPKSNPHLAELIEKAKTQTIVFQQNTTDLSAETAEIRQPTSDIEDPLSINAFKMYFTRHLPLIVTIWLLGVAAFILRLLSGISYTAYLRNKMNFPTDEYWLETLENLKNKIGLKQTIELVESALVRSPMVVGHLKPMILFPIGAINRLNPNEVEAILAHEIAHILRKDYLFNIIQSIIEALFYFHPAVWWLSSVVRSERENCCDDVAIKICGNSMTYAKSLVSVQEMAYFPTQMALGFAGNKKNELLIRIQRVLNQPYKNINNMEKIIATTLIIASLIGITYAQRHVNTPQKAEKITEGSFIQDGDAPLSIAGFWNADIRDNQVCVNFNSRNDDWNMMTSDCFDKKEFSNLPTQESEFQMIRQVGTITYKGKFDGNEGYGKFTFSGDETFKTYLENELSITKIKDIDLFHLFMSNINKEYIANLKQNGFNKISKSQLIQLAIHRVDNDLIKTYLAAFNKNELSIDKLIQFRIHGVDGDYIKEMRAIFANISADELVQGKIHGVDNEFITDLKKSKVEFSNFDQLVQFKIHGVDGDFANKMNAANKKQLQADELINAKIHGIEPDEIEKMQKANDGKLNAEDLQNFAIQGVTPEFIEDMNKAGFGKLNSEQLMAAKIHGITPEWAKQLKANYPRMSFDQATGFAIHGVSSEFVSSLNQMGYTNVSADNLMAFKIHGITSSFIKDLKDNGINNLSADNLIAFKIHGVKANDVKKFQDLGFKNIDNDKLIAFQIHSVTPEFIKSIQNTGLNNIDEDQLIAFKIHGVTPQYIQQFKEKGYTLDAEDVLNKKIRGSGQTSSKQSNGNYNFNVRVPDINVKIEPLPRLNPLHSGDEDDNNSGLKSRDKSPDIMTTSFNLLKKDGLIQEGTNRIYDIKLTAENWVINGKSLDANTVKKYNAIIEKALGRKLKNKDKLTFKGKINRISNDDVSINGNFNVDFDD
jgi:beta-lactamase regulating signal transducer with metallopeptidase domain